MLPPMLPRAARRSPILLLAGLTALFVLPGCEEKIGDSCEYNVDCSKMGERLCDLSSPGGYCTIENCTGDSCPEEAVCIAFYPVAYLITPCDPNTEDGLDPETATNHCTPDELCIRSGFCSPRASERRWCMRECDDHGDCRDGYECRRTGLDGAERVPKLNEPRSDEVARFCAPAE